MASEAEKKRVEEALKRWEEWRKSKNFRADQQAQTKLAVNSQSRGTRQRGGAASSQ